MDSLYLIVLLAGMLIFAACTSADPESNPESTPDSTPESTPESATDSTTDSTPRADLALLEAHVRSIIEKAEGDFAVSFSLIGDPGTNLHIHADEWFHAASTMKTPVMIEVHRQALEGAYSLDDKLMVKNEFISIADGKPYSLSIDRDSGDALYEHIGSEMSIRELMYSMIVRSGNLATNLVIEHAGAENVNRTMAEMGADGIRVLRGVEDMAAFQAGMNNQVTARGLSVMYQRLAEGAILSEEARNEIISVLKEQYYRDMIPARLPDDVEVAHKTGWITGVRHDSGIVYLPDGRAYTLVILSKNVPDRVVGNETGAEISRVIYDYMMDGAL